MKKTLLLLSMLYFTSAAFAQLKIAATNQFSITEKSTTRYVFNMDKYHTFSERHIGDVVMFSSKGEEKAPRRNVKGILLKDVISKTDLKVSQMKELNQFYFFLEASDGFKVVLSRNEIFNTDNLYIITSADGINLKDSRDRIEILALSEAGKGHILMKGLKNISVQKIGW